MWEERSARRNRLVERGSARCKSYEWVMTEVEDDTSVSLL